MAGAKIWRHQWRIVAADRRRRQNSENQHQQLSGDMCSVLAYGRGLVVDAGVQQRASVNIVKAISA